MKVVLLMAVTVDGKIGRNSLELVDWTGKDDKQKFIRITRDAGVMIMGSKTFDTIKKVLPGRKSIVMTRNKKRISNRVSHRISNDEDLVFTNAEPQNILKDLEAQGYKTVTLIGGAVINTIFAKNNLIDEIYLTLVPKLFGKGLSLFNESLDMDLELISMENLEKDHFLFHYRVKK
ncbi:MAG: dihydrofolate reductase [Desulfobacteraceae bacterium]|nr:dihydrofolate reductase [Desulfobacteraceae bacterium]